MFTVFSSELKYNTHYDVLISQAFTQDSLKNQEHLNI